MASDAYVYGLSAPTRMRYIASKHNEVVQRWLETCNPPISSTVAQASTINLTLPLLAKLCIF